MADTSTWTLVTGALGGLGTAMVERLLAAGHSVVACDRRAADYTSWVERITPEARDRLVFRALDVTREDEVKALAPALREKGILVTRLVNNAGVQGAADLSKVESRLWEIVLRVNLHGTFYMTRTFSTAMVERGFGRIVNLASVYAYHPGRGQSPYAAAKAGIIGYTRATALELAKYSVTANVIVPGLIWHDRLRGVVSEEEASAVIARIPAGRAGRPEEIAAAVEFLLSDDSSYVTGQTIHVNGGLYLPG